MQIKLIGGLPGAGKTVFAGRLAKTDPEAMVLDDICNLDQLPDTMMTGTLIITDPYFCLARVQELAQRALVAKYPSATITWYFFENSTEKCRRNVAWRNDGREVDGLITLLSAHYSVPDDAIVMSVWHPEA